MHAVLLVLAVLAVAGVWLCIPLLCTRIAQPRERSQGQGQSAIAELIIPGALSHASPQGARSSVASAGEAAIPKMRGMRQRPLYQGNEAAFHVMRMGEQCGECCWAKE